MLTERILIEVTEKGARVVKRSIDDIGKASEKADNSVITLKKALGSLAAVFATLKLKSLISESVQLNQRYKELGISLSVVGRNVGISRVEMDKAVTSIRKMGISMIESRQAVLKLATSNIDLANATKLADLARNAAIVGQLNTSDTLNRIINALRSGEVEILKTISLNVNFQKSYEDLAAELGKTAKSLTTVEKQTARVNIVLKEGPKLAGLYEASMNNAGKQFRSTARLVEDLKVQFGEIFSTTAENLVKAYSNSLKDLDVTIKELTKSGDIQRWGDNIALTFALIADTGRLVDSIFTIIGKTIGASVAQAQALLNLDFDAFRSIQASLEQDIQNELDGLGKFQAAVESSIIQRDLLTDAVTGVSAAIKKQIAPVDGLTDANKKAKKASEDFIIALNNEIASLGKTEKELRKIEAANLGVLDVTDELIDKLFEEKEALDLLNSDLEQAAAITNALKTSSELYSDELINLNRLYEDGRISLITYNRAIEQLDDNFNELKDSTRGIFGDLEQFSTQAARNIQSAFADFLFDPFDGGLKGMLSAFKNILKRMVAEIAAAGLLKGISSLLSGGSFLGGLTGGIGGAGAGTSGLLSGLTLGLKDVISTGAGLIPFIGEAISLGGSALGSGAATAFGEALAGDALGGLIAGTEAGLSGTAAASAASSGAQLASAASSLSSIAAGIGIGAFAGGVIAGDKGFGGIATGQNLALAGAAAGAVVGSVVPVIGTFVGAVVGGIIGGLSAAIGGRGPLKFKDETLFGDVTAEGFKGVLSERFKAKGGLARSSRTDRIIADTDSGEVLNKFKNLTESGVSGKLTKFIDPTIQQALKFGEFLDAQIKGFTVSLRGVADAFGISAIGLDEFSSEVKLVSKKGKSLTEQDLAGFLLEISDQMANALIPNLEELSREGEGTFETIKRLSFEFTSFRAAIQVLGSTLEDAKNSAKAFDFGEKSAIINALGGLDQFNEKMKFFAENFLTQSRRIEISTENVNSELEKFGLTVEGTSIKAFGELLDSVLSLGVEGAQTANVLFAIAPGFIELRKAQGDLGVQTDALTASTNSLFNAELGLFGLRRQLADVINKSESEALRNIDAFERLADSLLSTRDRLALGDLSPLTPKQKLAEARSQLDALIPDALAGDQEALAKLPDAVTAFLQASRKFNTSSPQFTADFNFVQDLLEQAARVAVKQVSIEQETLDAARRLTDTLIGNTDAVITLEEAIRQLTAATLQDTGNPNVNNQQILSILNNNNLTDQEKLTEAIRLGLSQAQILEATGIDEQSFNRFTGGLGVRDQDIIDAINNPDNSPFDLLKAAVDNGISMQRIADVLGSTLLEIQQFVLNNTTASERLSVGGEAASLRGVTVDNGSGPQEVVVSNNSNPVRITDAEIIRALNNVNNSPSQLLSAAIEGNFDLERILVLLERLRDAPAPNLVETRELFRAAVTGGQNTPTGNTTPTISNVVPINPIENITQTPTTSNVVPISTGTTSPQISDSQIADFVNANISDPLAIYSAAIQNGINSSRLASASSLTIDQINAFVAENNLAAFETGTDRTTSDGFAFLHKNEAVTPSSMTDEVKAMRVEMALLRKEQAENSKRLATVIMISSKRNSDAISQSQADVSQDDAWKNRSEAKIR